MESNQRETVLITGITGYVGSWVGKYFLDNAKDRFKIRGMVRDLRNKDKMNPLRKAYGEENYNDIQFVEGNLTKKDSLKQAVNGVQYIVHVAAPTPGVKNLSEEEMVIPTVEGMKTIIEAAQANQVKRIVVTSSFQTMVGNVWKKDTGEYLYTEKDFAPYETADSHAKSKIALERTIRLFLDQQNNTTGHKLEIVIINPTFALGPTLITSKNSTCEGVAKIIRRDVPGIPSLIIPGIDVRELAHAHFEAMVRPGLSGKRITISHESLPFTTIAEYLNEELKQYGYKVRTKKVSACPIKLLAMFDSQMRVIVPYIGHHIEADNSLSKELLGLQYPHNARQTIIDMGYSLIDNGLVPDKRNKKK